MIGTKKRLICTLKFVPAHQKKYSYVDVHLKRSGFVPIDILHYLQSASKVADDVGISLVGGCKAEMILLRLWKGKSAAK